MRRRFVVATLGLVSACAGLTGLDGYVIGHDAPDAAPVVDATDVEAAVEAAAPCPYGPAGSSVIAHHVADGAITVDGVLGEWPCQWLNRLDAADAGGHIVTPRTSVSFASAWTNDGFFFAAQVFDVVPPATNDAVLNYLNDAFEVYLGGDPAGGNPTDHDVHLIVDYLDRAKAYPYADAGFDPSSLGITFGAVATDAGFTVEAFIPKAAIHVSGIAAGAFFPFDLQVDEHATTDAGRPAYWLYANDFDGSARCGLPPQPVCDTSLWGTLTLAP